MHRLVRGLGALVVAGVISGSVSGCDPAGSAVVSRVIDGDTIDVTADGRDQRVRLLNVDTPETKDPDEDVQCMGPEASAFLAALLPPGTPVDLVLDDEHVDGYGRLLAGVYLPDGRLVNAELARAGLGVPIVVGGNDRFAEEVRSAQNEAVGARRGLYDPEVDCTVPGQVTDAENALATTMAAGSEPTTPEGADQAAAAAGAVWATAVALRTKFVPSPRAVAWMAAGALSGLQVRTNQVVTLSEGRRTIMTGRAAALRTPPPPPPRDTRPPEDPPSAGASSSKPDPDPKPRTTSSGKRPTSDAARGPAPSSGGSASAPSTGSGAAVKGKRNKYSAPQRCYAPGGKTWRPC